MLYIVILAVLTETNSANLNSSSVRVKGSPNPSSSQDAIHGIHDFLAAQGSARVLILANLGG